MLTLVCRGDGGANFLIGHALCTLLVPPAAAAAVPQSRAEPPMTPALASYDLTGILGIPLSKCLAPVHPDEFCSFGAEHLWINHPFWVSLLAVPQEEPGLTLKLVET